MRHNAGIAALLGALEHKRVNKRNCAANLEYTRKQYEKAELEDAAAALEVKQIEDMLEACTKLSTAFRVSISG